MNVRSILKGVAGWLGVGRKRVSRPARRTALRLEALEQREVPAPLAGDVVQTVADLNRISGFYRAASDLPLIQNDVRNLVSAAQAGRAPQAVYQLQNDMGQTTRRYGSFAPLVSNDPAMQRDVNALLRDVNPGYGPPPSGGYGAPGYGPNGQLNYGPALGGLSSPNAQAWVNARFGGPVSNPPASNNFGTFGSYVAPTPSYPAPSFGAVSQPVFAGPAPTAQSGIGAVFGVSSPGLQQQLNALGLGGYSTRGPLDLVIGPSLGSGYFSANGTSPAGPHGINAAAPLVAHAYGDVGY